MRTTLREEYIRFIISSPTDTRICKDSPDSTNYRRIIHYLARNMRNILFPITGMHILLPRRLLLHYSFSPSETLMLRSGAQDIRHSDGRKVTLGPHSSHGPISQESIAIVLDLVFGSSSTALRIYISKA